MNILRFSTLSMTLAVAVFALGYATPLEAQDPACLEGAFCDRDGDTFFKDHRRCASAGCSVPTDCDDSAFSLENQCADTNVPATTFIINFVESENTKTEDNLLKTSGTCVGLTTNSSKLNTRFPADSTIRRDSGCGPVLVNGIGNVYVFSIDVRANKKPPDAFVSFTSDPGLGVPNTVYDTGLMRVQGTIESLSAGSFQFVLDEPDMKLRQLHDPGKGDVFLNAVSIGNIVYTPN